jgi:hypothetical protein
MIFYKSGLLDNVSLIFGVPFIYDVSISVNNIN